MKKYRLKEDTCFHAKGTIIELTKKSGDLEGEKTYYITTSLGNYNGFINLCNIENNSLWEEVREETEDHVCDGLLTSNPPQCSQCFNNEEDIIIDDYNYDVNEIL